MNERWDKSDGVDDFIGPAVRGVCFGVLAVAATIVWAISFAPLIQGKFTGGFLPLTFRLIVCEAIPIATLFCIYRGIGKNHSLGTTVLSILQTIFWLPNRQTEETRLQDQFEEF